MVLVIGKPKYRFPGLDSGDLDSALILVLQQAFPGDFYDWVDLGTHDANTGGLTLVHSFLCHKKNDWEERRKRQGVYLFFIKVAWLLNPDYWKSQ